MATEALMDRQTEGFLTDTTINNRKRLLQNRYSASTRDIQYIYNNRPQLLTLEELDQKEEEFQQYSDEHKRFVPREFISLDPRILLKSSDELRNKEEARLTKLGIQDSHRAILVNPSLPFIPNEEFNDFITAVKTIGISNGMAMINRNYRSINYSFFVYYDAINSLISYGKSNKAERLNDYFANPAQTICERPEIAHDLEADKNLDAKSKRLNIIIKSFQETYGIKRPLQLLSQHPILYLKGISKLDNISQHFTQGIEAKIAKFILNQHPKLLEKENKEIVNIIQKAIKRYKAKHSLTDIETTTKKTADRLTKQIRQPPRKTELAAELGISIPTLNARITRAKKKGVEIQTFKPDSKTGLTFVETITKETVDRLTKQEGRFPTKTELAKELGVTFETVHKRITRAKKKGVEIQTFKHDPKTELTFIENTTKKTADRLTKQKGRPPRTTELADELGIPRSTLTGRIRNIRKKGVEIKTLKPDPKTGLTFIETTTQEAADRLTKQKGRPPRRKELADELSIKNTTLDERIKSAKKKGINIQISKNIDPKTDLTKKQKQTQEAA
jgi:biotin operon repressor